MIPWVLTRRRDRGETGQVIVIFATSLILLMGAAGLAFDVGRFYGERRFLQNAADAGALAIANALIRGENAIDAEAEGRDVLARNFIGGPNGSPSLPSVVPIYETGYAGDPARLIDGILIGGGDIRVAVRHDVGYTFGRVVGLDSNRIGAQARASNRGRLLPIAVAHYLNPSGPLTSLATCPLPIDLSTFVDVFATGLTACLGDLLNAVLRVLPEPGAPWDPLNPDNDPTRTGPHVPILGQGAQPANGADFRGFVALDIRNFAVAGNQLYYNSIPFNTKANSIKDETADYIYRKGYPGPDFPPVVSPPDPNLQVATMNGNSTGVAIDAMNATYAPGDKILVTVYSGNVLTIPDFAITAPALIDLPSTGLTVNAGALRVSRNQAFSGTVTLSTLADTLDPASPMLLGTLLGLDPILYIPNPVTPSLGSGTSVLMNQLTTLGATPGIYTVWIKGQAGSPYITTKYVAVPIKIGTVTRDFTLTSDTQAADAANPGDSVAFSLTLQNAPVKNTNFGGPTTLSVDSLLPSGTPHTFPAGSFTFGTTSVTPTKPGASTTLTVNTTGWSPGSHQFVVRATGLNGDAIPRGVTHLLQLQVNVSTGGSGSEYVDIIGFAVMELGAMDANTIHARAVSGVYADMNDPALRRAQMARLVPWD